MSVALGISFWNRVLWLYIRLFLIYCRCCNRYVSAKAKGRADLDWSAIGMDISEAAGIDVSKDVDRNIQDVKDGRTY